MSPSPQLSVILPCRDQADHIGAVLDHHRAALSKVDVPWEMVVVPNSCRDATPEIARQVAGGDARVRVVPVEAGGWGRAVLAGMTSARGSVLCYANSARTQPSHVGELLRLYERSAPCVAKVSRQERHAPLRSAGSWIYNLEGRLLLRVRSTDVNGTPKMLSADLARRLDLGELGDLLDMELLAKAARLGVPVVEMPVAGFTRHGGRSSTGIMSAFRMYLGVIPLRKRLAGFPHRAP